jgi:hypothetical protein
VTDYTRDKRELIQVLLPLQFHLNRVEDHFRMNNVDVSDLFAAVRQWISDSVEYPDEQIEVMFGLPSSQAP